MRGRCGQIAVLGLAILALSAPAARAAPRVPGSNSLASPLTYPGAPKPPAPETQKQPYAMNYSDEAAQTLGVRDGRLDVFSTRPSPRNGLMPSLSGGVGGDGAMLRLQWRPGY